MLTNPHPERRPLAAAVVLALTAAGAHAATITVLSGGDSGDLSTCTLRQAIDSINNATLDGSACVNGSVDDFGSNDAIVFDGALQDSTITLGGSQLEIAAPVTISGSSQTLDGAASSRVLFVDFNVGSVTLSNLRVRNGNAPEAGGICVANAACASDSGPTAARFPAATPRTMAAYTVTSVVLEQVVVDGNTSGNYGGGVQCDGPAYLTLNRSVVAGNSVDLGDMGHYGAGGIYAADCTVAISDSTISGNSATGSAEALVGGMYLWQSDATIVNTTISGNSANGQHVVVGGMSTSKNVGFMSNCTIAGNSAGSTVSGYGAGGVLVGIASSGTLQLVNSIVAGNSSDDADFFVHEGVAAIGHSLLGSTSYAPAYAGNGNVFSDTPMLAALADNGGPTPTLALLDGSPALDAGDPVLALAADLGDPLNYDQRGRGFPRTLGGMVDIGAFQHQTGRIFADGNEPEP